MLRGTSYQHITYFTLCLILVLTTGLSACDKTSNISGVEKALPPCKLAESNLIQSTSIPAIPTIIQYSATATSVPTPSTPAPESDATKQQKFIGARYAALRLLSNEVKRWTHIISYQLDSSTYAQITLTYLGPEVVQVIYFNDFLKRNPPAVDIDIAVQAKLKEFVLRNELVFLVTATIFNENSENTIPHTLTLNPHEMKLTNTKDLIIRPEHDDPILGQSIGVSQVVSGYLYYPTAVLSDGICLKILDKVHNTKINLQVSDITVDNAKIATQTWTIDFSPLLDTGHEDYQPDYFIPENITFPTSDEPADLVPTGKLPVGQKSPSFWDDLARYIWGQVTLSNHQ